MEQSTGVSDAFLKFKLTELMLKKDSTAPVEDVHLARLEFSRADRC